MVWLGPNKEWFVLVGLDILIWGHEPYLNLLIMFSDED